MYTGSNLYKFDKDGNLIWNRSIGHVANSDANSIFIHNEILYITGTFYSSLTINNQITLTNTAYTGYYIYNPLLFIATFDLNGNLKKAQKYGNSDADYTSSEMDKNGNLYFSRYSNRNSNYTHADIDKIDSNLNIVWTKEISNNKTNYSSVFRPTLLHYNSNNNKLYLWGGYIGLADILGNIFTDNSMGYLKQSILCEFNNTNLDLERIKQITNSSTKELPGIGGSSTGNNAHITEKNDELFILTSFRGSMTFPNTTITSRTNSEELVLFKINLNTFEPEFILKSSGTNYYVNGNSVDSAGPILFNGNDLFLTSNFQSYPLVINNSVINNNSGNNSTDVMLYKYKLDSSINSGEIIVENTCFNTPTLFEVKGNFDSILWNFDDPTTTTNNTAAIYTPQHLFSSPGTYHITATVTCGSQSQTLEKDMKINSQPGLNTVAPIYSCESISESGISNSFDTSNINSTILGNQTDLIIEYRDSNGNLLPSPLPNPYTNRVKNEETISIKSFFNNNPYCFVETNLKLYTLPKPFPPITSSPQNFCIQQNAKITDITITGQNIKWYDALTNGNLLSTTTLLQNNTNYYTSQTLNGCESERVAVLINIQNTSMPTANANQSFCTGSNPTIANIQITANTIKWYDALNNGSLVTETTNLVDGKTYYASQMVNNCESERLGVSISIVNTPSAPTVNGNQFFCKNENATLADIQITGQNIKWYDANFAAAVLPNTTLLEDNKTYYASQTIGCESDRIPILIRVYNTPIPTANKNQQFCIAENATIANLSITGSNIKWYQDAANGTVLAETTWLENNKTYFATQTANNCESERLAITVKIQDTQIPIANSPQTFCIQENAKISDIVITGQNVNWFESASSSINLSESTLLENGITYYASETINNCESERIPVAINILEATTGDCINFVDKLPYPKFFTPNNDGYNDTWTIDFAYLKPNTGIQIYDRYGKLLKVLLLNGSWNGQFNSQELPATDYWFVVTRANGQEYKSHFSLKR